MKVYKGTDKEIKCRGYQFKPGVEAVEYRAELCEAGFHACEAPLDVLGYYPPGAGSRYFEAELEDVSLERHDYDVKEWKAGLIDGETLKADTWYKLKNGEFVEVSDDE